MNKKEEALQKHLDYLEEKCHIKKMEEKIIIEIKQQTNEYPKIIGDMRLQQTLDFYSRKDGRVSLEDIIVLSYLMGYEDRREDE